MPARFAVCSETSNKEQLSHLSVSPLKYLHVPLQQQRTTQNNRPFECSLGKSTTADLDAPKIEVHETADMVPPT
ncbi:unnamed protein product [Toxocara canis]|uniref:Uncharacterized protein n=1 Tax=Toxocara canis TaxID=6265 RepID=A0A183UQT5_TOXCA|nr:unnamed protein product [Toxocara canis]